MKSKLKQIQDIYSSWIGLYISPTNAMSQIGDVLARRATVGMNLSCIDITSGKVLLEAKTAKISYCERK
jgi:hypothetical protein